MNETEWKMSPNALGGREGIREMVWSVGRSAARANVAILYVNRLSETVVLIEGADPRTHGTHPPARNTHQHFRGYRKSY